MAQDDVINHQQNTNEALKIGSLAQWEKIYKKLVV